MQELTIIASIALGAITHSLLTRYFPGPCKSCEEKQNVITMLVNELEECQEGSVSGE